MKTAMQELINDLKQLSEDKFNDKIEFTDFIKKQEELVEIGLKKEKEQIDKACYDGYYLEDEKYTYEYYNQTYNQNK